jgi:glutamine amidotransferase-like uncharacterized protein
MITLYNRVRLMKENIFIYNGAGAGTNSSYDLKELFIRHGAEIYTNADSFEVQFTDFNMNFDGLSPEAMTIVLPGGSVVAMGCNLFNHKTKIQSLFSANAKGVFICAGAYLATSNADLFNDSYSVSFNDDTFNLPEYRRSTLEYYSEPKMDLNLDIVCDYKAVGPFIPNDSYFPLRTTYNLTKPGVGKPYVVDVLFETDQAISKQTYLGGCGFEPLEALVENPCNVVARYHERSRYSFFYPRAEVKNIDAMPAIIRKPGVLLSGPHIETCVEDSQLLKLFREGKDAKFLPLPPEETYNAEEAREHTIPLLRDTLNIRRG